VRLRANRAETAERLIEVAKLVRQGLEPIEIARRIYKTEKPSASQRNGVYAWIHRAQVHEKTPPAWGPPGSGGIAKCLRCKGSGKRGPQTCLQCLGQGCGRIVPPKVGRPLSEFYMRTGCALANVV
jgi:hypothetical protein